MEVAAMEMAVHPDDKLLAKYLDAPGARMVERLFKAAIFSLETSPSPSPAAPRRRRLNINDPRRRAAASFAPLLWPTQLTI